MRLNNNLSSGGARAKFSLFRVLVFFDLIAGLVFLMFFPTFDKIITEAQYKQMTEGVYHYSQILEKDDFKSELDKLKFMDEWQCFQGLAVNLKQIELIK